VTILLIDSAAPSSLNFADYDSTRSDLLNRERESAGRLGCGRASPFNVGSNLPRPFLETASS